MAVRKRQNIGLLGAKVPMFGIESTDVCLKEVRCFLVPEVTYCSTPFTTVAKKLPLALYHLPSEGVPSLKVPSK